MKNSLLMPVVLSALLFVACKKEPVAEKPEQEEYVQFFDAQVGTQQVSIRNSLNDNRNFFQGRWTGVGNGKGEFTDMYTVDIQLPKEQESDAKVLRLRFQIFDIKKKQYQITGKDRFYEDFGTYIGLVKSLGNSNGVLYVPNINKQPFEIVITKYEYANGSGTPTVGGTLNGTLYNEKNADDFIAIKNGKFEIRY